ncbi:MAG: hypothetical protein U1F43_01435 [Myxococcota bacterium]
MSIRADLGLGLALALAACGDASTSPDTSTSTSPDTITSTDADAEVTAPAPTLASIDPPLGDTLGGVRAALAGTHLLATTAITIGGLACADLAVADDAHATCVAPALAAGHYDVALATPDGTATLLAAYEAWSPTQIADARVYTSAAGLTLDAPLGPAWLWEQRASSAPWHPRDGAGLVWLAGKLWLLGGWYSPQVAEWHDQYTTNEVWSSDDVGATWTLELPDDPSPPESGPGARWLPRHTAGWLTYEYDNVEYAYVVGGDIFHVTGDVWRSADGVTWEEVTAHAPWEGRVLQMVGTYAGDLYLMGGQTSIADPSTVLHDVWRSRDGGASWTRLADAPWAARGMAYNPVEFDGKLWLMGGGTYDDDGPRIFYNDVWSFDGASWVEVSPDGAAPWTGREYHNTFAAGGELWVSSGYEADQLNHNDFWHSADGVAWTRAANAPMQPGHADAIAITPSGVVHASGNAMDGYVFRMRPGRGAALAVGRRERARRPPGGRRPRRGRSSSRARSARRTACGSTAPTPSCTWPRARRSPTAGASSGSAAPAAAPPGSTTSTRA